MDRETVSVFSTVAQKLAEAKLLLSDALREKDLPAYTAIRDLLGDCQESMALHCDCAPIKLIAGRLDEI
jgi:hypothetical protein